MDCMQVEDINDAAAYLHKDDQMHTWLINYQLMNGLWLGLRSITTVLQEINEKIMVKNLRKCHFNDF